MIRKLLCWLGLVPHEWETHMICSIYVEGDSVNGTTLINDYRKRPYQRCKHCGRIKP